MTPQKYLKKQLFIKSGVHSTMLLLLIIVTYNHLIHYITIPIKIIIAPILGNGNSTAGVTTKSGHLSYAHCA